jgi:aminoglycoside phosphotransferase (APT) family kinase protein
LEIIVMTDPQFLIQRLSDFLAAQSGQTIVITRAVPLAGGASRDMWRIDATFDSHPQALVLRRDLPTTMVESALSRADEYAIMSAAYAAGVRVARPRFLCTDAQVLGGAFFIMDYVDGIGIGRKVVTLPELADARAALPVQMADQLARIHHIDPAPFRFLPRPPHGIIPAAHAIVQTYALLDALGVRSPIFEFCLRWAFQHMPPPNAPAFCHGDFRIGNLIVAAHGLAAVADWEFTHVGDPDEELGYLCMRDWRFGNGRLRLGGIADREPFLAAYEAASGRIVSRASVDYWEILGNIRWGVICLSQAERHLSGRDRSVELASLGRRSVEMGYEALRLIERMEAGS